MALCVCKCLNVTLECDKIEDNVDTGKMELTSMEQRDIFFSEKVIVSSTNELRSHLVQPALVSERTVDRWTLHSCLACGQTTHAILNGRNGPNKILIPRSLQATPERIQYLKKTKNFSPVFNLLVPEVTNDIEMKENIDTNNYIVSDKIVLPPTHQVIGTLSKQLKKTLTLQLEAIEEAVRQFREQKYAEYEAYKQRAQRDHNMLASIISKARSNFEHEWHVDTSLDNGPSSPQPPLQRRRLSSIKDAKKIPHNIIKSNRILPPEEDSLELFDFDMDSRNMSDLEDSESDEGSNDEGIHISGPRGGKMLDMARSLPMNIAKFPNECVPRRELEDDEGPADIAASIKALARSVHGDVYDLPRPRFSTQI